VLHGLYSAAAGMAAHESWLDMLSNDVANVNTPGYHRQRVEFRDLALSAEGGIAVGAGAAAGTIGVSQRQGTLLPSDSPLALAISGPGWFQVQRSDGTIALTRGGDFRLDAQGAIVLATGERLVPPITVPPGTDADAIGVAPDGTVTVGTTAIGQITIVDVPAASGLLAVGGGLYVPTEASGAPAVRTGIRIDQRVLEASNVELADAMVGVIQAQRGYQLASRAVRVQDQLLEIVNQIRR
jgi:flagellar basal-body rod protein FlgG